MVYQGDLLYWDYIYTGKHNPSPFPPLPIPAHVGGEYPYTISPLVAAWHKVPFSGIVALPYLDPSWSTDRTVTIATMELTTVMLSTLAECISMTAF